MSHECVGIIKTTIIPTRFHYNEQNYEQSKKTSGKDIKLLWLQLQIFYTTKYVQNYLLYNNFLSLCIFQTRNLLFVLFYFKIIFKKTIITQIMFLSSNLIIITVC